MDLAVPYSLFLRSSEGGVLGVLAGTTRPLSGREVARLSGDSPSTVWRTLQRLSEHGVVHVQEAGAGAALLYTLNRDHVAAEAILMLVGLRRRFLDRLTNAVEGWPLPPVHASVFGSAARGDGDTASDVDLFIVRPARVGEEDVRWRDQLDRLADQVRAWTGNRAAIAEVSEDDARRLARERPPIVAELEREAVVVEGPTMHEFFATAVR